MNLNFINKYKYFVLDLPLKPLNHSFLAFRIKSISMVFNYFNVYGPEESIFPGQTFATCSSEATRQIVL